MNKVSLGEIKIYLGLDGEEQNKLLAVFLETAENIVEKVLRYKINEHTPEIAQSAILYVIWQLYFHRDDKDFNANELEKTVAVLLSDLRKMEF